MLDRDILNKIRRNEKTVNKVELTQPIAPKEITKIIDALSYNTYLKTITIHGPVEENALLTLANIKHSITLVFSNTPLSMTVLKALADNSLLKQLEIAHSKLGVQGAKTLANSKTIKTLCLSHCSIEIEGLKEIANSTNSPLQALHITNIYSMQVGFGYPHYNNQFSGFNSNAFGQSNQTPLSNQKNQAIKEVIELFGKNLKLIKLSLCHNGLTTEETQPFSNPVLFRYLKLLNLSHNHIDSAKYLAKMPLRSLNLSYNAIATIEGITNSKEGAKYNLIKNRYLKEIYLMGNSRLTDSPSQLYAFKENKTLRFVDVVESHLREINSTMTLNRQYEIQRKNDFVRTFCMFAKETYHLNKNAQHKVAPVAALPQDIWIIILSFINFAKMDKNCNAGQACLAFIFKHISLLIEQPKQYKLAVIEKVNKNVVPYEYYYQFKAQNKPWQK